MIKPLRTAVCRLLGPSLLLLGPLLPTASAQFETRRFEPQQREPQQREPQQRDPQQREPRGQLQPQRVRSPVGGQRVQRWLNSVIDSRLPNDARLNTDDPQQARQRSPVDQPEEIRAAGNLLTQASEEMRSLIGALNDDTLRVNGVRQLLSMAMNINADAAVLSRRLSRARDVENLRDALRKLDQDWRALEYRLAQIQNLSRTSLGHIARIKRLEQQLADMFKLPTQVDNTELAREATRLNNSLRNLLEEMRFQVNDQQLANRLVQEGRLPYERSLRLMDAARSSATLQQLSNELRGFETEWSTYSRRLHVANNRFVQRQEQLVDNSLRALDALLYLDRPQVNREDLVYTARVLQNDVTQLMRQVNLEMLSDLPAGGQVVTATSEFQTSGRDLQEVLDNGDDLDVIRDVYRVMHDEWERVSIGMQSISSQQARQTLRDMDRSMQEFRAQVGIQFDFDRNAATQLATTLASDAKHVQEDIREIFGRANSYPRELSDQALRASAQFYGYARELRDGLSSGRKLRNLKTECDAMSSAWENLVRYIPSFQSKEQRHLTNLRRDITPQVVQMQTLLSY